MKEQPLALKLADAIEYPQIALLPETRNKAAAELRRLHSLNAELVEALQAFPGFICGIAVGDAWIEKMRDALAKATGEQQ